MNDMITAQSLREKFLRYFAQKGHAIIPSAAVVPDNDPTTLFNTAGMQPLVPYLMGQPHSQGTRLADVQKCVRTVDIEEVGDATHLTFFEMLGNWSLGDYFKKEAITWSWEFLTAPEYLGLNPEKLFVTVFAGDADAGRDEESAAIWTQVLAQTGVSHPEKRIYYYPKSDNWWGPAGQTGPCGPDTEIFYYTGNDDPFRPGFADEPAHSGGGFTEVWNNVFMQFNKQADGSFTKLAQHNVDTGLGLERMTAILNWFAGNIPAPDPYLTTLFSAVMAGLETASGKKYAQEDEVRRSMRIAADHFRAAVFIVQDGVVPTNKERGYVLRRLIRRAVRELYKLGIDQTKIGETVTNIINIFIDNPEYNQQYPELISNRTAIAAVIGGEVLKFTKTLHKGLQEIGKHEALDGHIAFDVYQTYGFPLEMTQEIARERGQQIDANAFRSEFAQHQELSRQQSAQNFKGGLADHSEATTRFHTATHLLHAALRRVLGESVHQDGSNITADRLRFDFIFDRALTESELKQVEDWINAQIVADLPVTVATMPKAEALASGAMAFFKEKYPEVVTVYTIGPADSWVSRELCGGPHVTHTGEIGQIEIFKQKAVSASVRRVYLRWRP
jgi:alanyl-tRNA synthetase